MNFKDNEVMGKYLLVLYKEGENIKEFEFGEHPRYNLDGDDSNMYLIDDLKNTIEIWEEEDEN